MDQETERDLVFEGLLSIGHVAAAVSHQIINAFSTIVSQAEILRSHTSDSESHTSELASRAATMVQTALDASQLARKLIECSRSVTGLDSPLVASSAEPIRLNELLESYVDSLDRPDQTNVEVILDLRPVPQFRGHAIQLKMMLAELLSNSREAMLDRPGKITLSTSTNGRGWLVLEVTDNGPGMEPTVLERAMEPFFSTKPERNGLGLTIARGIWRRHRGTVSLESQLDIGTTIRLSVPGYLV